MLSLFLVVVGNFRWANHLDIRICPNKVTTPAFQANENAAVDNVHTGSRIVLGVVTTAAERTAEEEDFGGTGTVQD